MIYTKFDALMSLKPNGQYTWVGTDYANLTGSDKPSESDIDAELVRLQAEYDANQYQRNRATDYPAIAEQLDEIYHNGIDSWKAVIKVTKDKYPKG